MVLAAVLLKIPLEVAKTTTTHLIFVEFLLLKKSQPIHFLRFFPKLLLVFPWIDESNVLELLGAGKRVEFRHAGAQWCQQSVGSGSVGVEVVD